MFQKMTGKEARDVVASMKAETKKNARVFVMQQALKSDRLTDEAREVYKQALKDDGAK